MLRICLWLTLPLLLMCCKSPQPLPPENLAEMKARLSYSKGPCMGTCPVSTISIYDNRMVLFEGLRFASKTGTFYRYLTGPEWRALKKQWKKIDWEGLPDRYPSDVADFPTLQLTFRKGENPKKITGQEGFPEELLQLMRLLDQIEQQGEWQGGAMR